MDAGARIDYVRLRLPYDLENQTDSVLDWQEAVAIICKRHGISQKCYDVSSYFDRPLTRFVKFFNVWGEAAQHFFKVLLPSEFHHLMRLDYREPVDAPGLDFVALFTQAEERNGLRNTVKRFRSPHRARRQGRDAGGDGLTIGGEGAQKRATIYKRAAEGAAFEYQLAGKELKKLVTSALSKGLTDNQTVNSVVYEALQAAAREFCTRKFGLSIEGMEAGLSIQTEVSDYTNEEQVLTQLSLLWGVLSDTGRKQFLIENTSAIGDEIDEMAAGELFTSAEDWDEDEGERPYALEVDELTGDTGHIGEPWAERMANEHRALYPIDEPELT